MYPVVLAIVLLVAYSAVMFKRRGLRSPAVRLSNLIAQRPDYLIFIGVPFAAPKEWSAATRQGADSLAAGSYGAVRISEVRAFIVAYANGQMLDCERCGLPLPEGLDGLSPALRAESDSLLPGDLEQGRAYVQITYGPSATRPKDRNHYATTLKNISAERIRVHRFAGYRRSGKGWRLATVTRQFYSAEEFREWYGLGPSEWLEPGQAVTDPNNYGAPPVLWAYYGETASGKQFVAGGALK